MSRREKMTEALTGRTAQAFCAVAVCLIAFAIIAQYLPPVVHEKFVDAPDVHTATKIVESPDEATVEKRMAELKAAGWRVKRLPDRPDMGFVWHRAEAETSGYP